MNEPFINHLNISDLFISKSSKFHSIEYCYLFLTSDSFRQKTPEKQQKSIDKLRAQYRIRNSKNPTIKHHLQKQSSHYSITIPTYTNCFSIPIIFSTKSLFLLSKPFYAHISSSSPKTNLFLSMTVDLTTKITYSLSTKWTTHSIRSSPKTTSTSSTHLWIP